MISEKNIDNLLNTSFENYEAPVSQGVRLKMSKRITRFNFFKFNPGTLNIFYLAPIIIGAGIILASSINSSSDKTDVKCADKFQTNNQIVVSIKSDQVISETEETETITSTNNSENTFTEETDTGNANNNNDITSSETTTSNNSNSILSEPDNNLNEDLSETGDNTNNGENDNEEVISKSTTTENTIYDTIVSTVNVTVADTVKTVVQETVTIKKPRKRNKK